MSSDPTATIPATEAEAPPETPPPPPPPAPAEERPERVERPGLNNLVVTLWSLALAIVVFAPLLASRGVALRGEMVFAPQHSLKASALGLDGWVGGAVPADFLVGLGGLLVPGDIMQKAILVGLVVLAGTGMGALLSGLGLVARLAGATFYIWNPFVFERLLVGDWTLLVGYAALPWIGWAARRVHTASLGELAPVVVFLALAGWTSPLGGVLGLLLAVLVLATRNGRAAIAVLLVGLVVNLPWIIPGLLRPGGPTGATESVDAFAVNAETPLGVLGSILTLGGVWDPAAFVPGRDNTVIAVLALVVALVALGGAVVLARRWDSGVVNAIAVLAVLGVVIALLGGLDATRSVMETLVDDLPGGSVFADGHAWLAPLALLMSVGFGALAGSIATALEESSGDAMGVVVGVFSVAVPIALLPPLALGLGGELDDARYPGDWWAARQAIEALDSDPQSIVVLPFSGDRAFAWNDGRTSVDPAAIYFPGRVVVDDQREIDGTVVPGSDPRAAAVREALGGSPAQFVATLAENGFDTVIIERNVPGQGTPGGALGDRVHRGPEIAVFSLPDDVEVADMADVDLEAPPSILVIAVDILAALVVLGAVGAWIAIGRRREDEPVAL